MAVLLRKDLNVEIWSEVLEPECKAVVLKANDNKGNAFRIGSDWSGALGVSTRQEDFLETFRVSEHLERHFGYTC